MRVTESDPAAAIVREWDLSAIVDATGEGTGTGGAISDDKGIESLTYSAVTGLFYVGIQDSSYIHTVSLSGAAPATVVETRAPAPGPTTHPVPEPTSADAISIAVVLTLTAAVAFDNSDAAKMATLQGSVAATAGIASADVKHFAVTSSAVRRRLLSGFAWVVTFDVVTSLSGSGAASSEDLASSLGSDLQANLAAAVASDLGVAVNVASVSAVPVTHGPTLEPSAQPKRWDLLRSIL